MGPLVVSADDPQRPLLVAELIDSRADYAEVFIRHQRRLLRLALLLTGDPDRAEDAVAEAFARSWPHWRRGRVVDEAAYLTRAVVNEVNSSGRRLGRTTRLVGRLRGLGDTADAGDAADRVAVLAALAELPARQRAVVVLRYYADLTEADTAAVLGMRIGTVKSQTARGLARLRLLLSEETT